MDGEGDQYEERLREVFQSFDGSGAGSLNPEELAELCHALQLNDTALHTLLHTLINSQDQLNARVEFEQFKNALILVLSSPTEEALANEENPTLPDSPEVQPRFIKGGKRYGRRSTPEFTHAISELSHMPPEEDEQEEEALGSTDGTLPSKRERWNADVSSAEEYEAEGQLHLWNPDEPGTPRGSMVPLSGLEERLQSACQQLALPLNGMATLHQLHALCQYIGMEVHGCMMSVQEFVSYILNKNKPPTPSASTPYRQLKRHHSIQPFDETGRRISSVLSSTIGLRLFSVLDDGTGHTAVEQLLDTWLEEGVENSSEILQALEFSLDGKVNLTELTAALENELLITKNSIHQAALVSFKAEIRHLLECVDLELREKEKIRSDLEKAEKLKSQLASEVDEHHSAIERINDLNLRKLEQEHKDHMVALRVEMSKEVELVQQQANQQREELEQEIRTIREDETFLRERLTLTIKENGRLEAELLDSTERLIEAEAQLSKLQRNLDSVLKEKFGDLDLSNAEFYQQEERLGQLRSNYEEQCRELQDRIDELQAQLEEYRAIGRTPQTSLMPSLSDELDSKSPGMESDQGLGSEEGQPFNMSLEAEMVLEQLKEQHVREMENIRAQLDCTVRHKLEEQKTSHEEERGLLSLQHQQDLQALKKEAAEALERAHGLQEQLEQERRSMEVLHGVKLDELRARHQKELSSLNQEVQDARSHALQLEEQLKELEESIMKEREELHKAHVEELSLLELQHKETLEATVKEERETLQVDRVEAEKRHAEEWEREKLQLKQIHKEVLRVRLEEAQQRSEQELMELERRLREEWEREKQQHEESNKAALQAVLEEELVRLLKEQEDRERKLTEQWDAERMLLEEQHHAQLQQQIQQEKERAQAQKEETMCRKMKEWEREKAQLQRQHDEVLQVRLEEQRERLQAEREELERRWQEVLEEEQSRMVEAHQEAIQELSVKHSEERERLGCMLEKLPLLKCVLKKLCCHLPLFQVQALDSTLQGLAQQNARLKSDLRITQQERDALKQEVISLHKQLQNANEKMSISSVPGGSQQGKRVWTELSGLMEAELTLLREENQRLQREINDARLEMNSAREKGRQLEALVLSVKQQKQQNQASLSKSAEQERSALKREIEALHTQLHNKEQREMESLQEENERLRNKQTILEAQLMEVFAHMHMDP
uniref:EF-hand domain-containing protein n=1 Tax=Pygocentrus nattereri TaxID=42514 RepID=A0A3B4DWB2_PYGNA